MTGVEPLSQTEREALRLACCSNEAHRFHGLHHVGACQVYEEPPYDAVAQIVAARLAPVEAERDAARTARDERWALNSKDAP